MTDEKKPERTFGCVSGQELNSLAYRAVTAVQAHSTGGKDRGEQVDSTCAFCTAAVMLHGAAIALRAYVPRDDSASQPFTRDEYLALAASIYDAHFALTPEYVEKLRAVYFRAVHQGLMAKALGRAVKEHVEETVAVAASATPKEKMN